MTWFVLKGEVPGGWKNGFGGYYATKHPKLWWMTCGNKSRFPLIVWRKAYSGQVKKTGLGDAAEELFHRGFKYICPHCKNTFERKKKILRKTARDVTLSMKCLKCRRVPENGFLCFYCKNVPSHCFCTAQMTQAFTIRYKGKESSKLSIHEPPNTYFLHCPGVCESMLEFRYKPSLEHVVNQRYSCAICRMLCLKPEKPSNQSKWRFRITCCMCID